MTFTTGSTLEIFTMIISITKRRSQVINLESPFFLSEFPIKYITDVTSQRQEHMVFIMSVFWGRSAV